ncbi:hypothetical protein Tco_0786752 [Tanacetum coccineum]
MVSLLLSLSLFILIVHFAKYINIPLGSFETYEAFINFKEVKKTVFTPYDSTIGIRTVYSSFQARVEIYGSIDYVDGCSMQRPPLLEPNGFCFWKARFETYVKSKDIDLWQVIQKGDFYYEVEDSETKLMNEMSYELLEDDQKKKLSKNNEAKMTLYNAPPQKEYERVFMCKTVKEVWHTLIITHQGNSQVKNCKIHLLTQEYEKFSISNE